MKNETGTDTSSIALFPLHTVLFPGGRLPLRIFETRYIDMVSACMRNERPFGVVAISSGNEVGAGAQFHLTGTLTLIESWDRGQDGLLHIVGRGGERFRVIEHEVGADTLVSATVARSPVTPCVPAPALAYLGETLGRLFEAQPAIAPALPWYFDNAEWVAYRFAELLPIDLNARIGLLELDDAHLKLESIGRLVEMANRARETPRRH